MTLEFAGELAGWWLPRLLTAAWQGSWLLAVAGAVGALGVRLPAGVRVWVWRLALLHLLLLLSPEVRLPLPILPFDGDEVSWQVVSLPGESPPLAATPLPQPDPAGSSPRLPWLLLGGWAVWAAGSALVFMLGVAAGLAVWRLLHLAAPCRHQGVGELSARLCAAFRLRPAPLVRLCPRSEVPFAAGWLRPTVVLPERLDLDEAGDLHLVLAHELAHVHRSDLLWNTLTWLVLAIFWFHPLVWLARREMELLGEVACDDLARGMTGASAHQYGDMLLRLTVIDSRFPELSTPGMTMSIRELRRRLLAMAAGRDAPLPASGLVLLLVTVAALPWRPTMRIPEAATAAIAPERYGDLRGRVVSPPGGPPVEGREVVAVVLTGPSPALGVGNTAVCDAIGRFLFVGLNAETAAVQLAQPGPPGWSAEPVTSLVAGGDVTRAPDLRLVPAFPVFVEVVDGHTGRGLPDRRVLAVAPGRLAQAIWAQTDQTGRASLSLPRGGEYTLTLPRSQGSYLPAVPGSVRVSETPSDPVRFVCPLGVRLHCRAVDEAGQPVHNAWLGVQDAPLVGHAGYTVTGPAGTARFTCRPHSRVVLQAWTNDGRRSAPVEVVVPEAVPGRVIELGDVVLRRPNRAVSSSYDSARDLEDP